MFTLHACVEGRRVVAERPHVTGRHVVPGQPCVEDWRNHMCTAGVLWPRDCTWTTGASLPSGHIWMAGMSWLSGRTWRAGVLHLCVVATDVVYDVVTGLVGVGQDRRWTRKDAAGRATGRESWDVAGRGGRDDAVTGRSVAGEGVVG